MARSALFLALAALLVLGAAAGDSSKNGGGSNKASKASDAGMAKLRPAPVCTALKEAAKNYGACSTFREELCLTVQSDNCDMCGFLQADDGCDLQSGTEVTNTVDTVVSAATAYIFSQVFGNIVPVGVTVSSASCPTVTVVPATVTATCAIVGTNTVVTVTCPADTIPTGVGCNDATLAVVPGSSPGVQLQTAQCVFPGTAVTGGIMNVYCIPSDVVPVAGAKLPAGLKATKVGKVAAGQKAIMSAFKLAAPNAAKKP